MQQRIKLDNNAAHHIQAYMEYKQYFIHDQLF